MRIDVTGPVVRTDKGGAYVPIDVHYKGKRFPTEDRLFLRTRNGEIVEDVPAKGTYVVDPEDLVYPDSRSFNRMSARLNASHLSRPAQAAKVGS